MIHDLYKALLETYGQQGWWPLVSRCPENAYHPGDYTPPQREEERFETLCGAILTQNTTWDNAQKAVHALRRSGIRSAATFLKTPPRDIQQCIRPAGYYNQKYEYLYTLLCFFQSIGMACPTRTDLLSLRGVGPETADTILLYAYGEPFFIVDAYTRRILSAYGAIPSHASYQAVQGIIMAEIPRDVRVYNEYHALLVAHGKRYYRGKHRTADPLRQIIPYHTSDTSDDGAL
ncbi:endonuclease III domain-containing protein [Chitinivibrio alkaliphilus]|uniref:Endonuclease III n=1 Tax=Chitinivibrio alkaliphilus ACht1 TaxID=1313304 RepID=U7D6P7_9BACT|nr:endonuclease III [Chitinivibrio alkaliphilus]ERP30757.1 endonuclease III [Chitinivibrio alkaliphilus ACht1]